MDFSSKLKKARELKNVSVDDLAEKLGVSRQTVYDWESGKSEPRKEKLYKLQQILGLDAKHHTEEFTVNNGDGESLEPGLAYKYIKTLERIVDGKDEEISWLRKHIDELTARTVLTVKEAG